MKYVMDSITEGDKEDIFHRALGHVLKHEGGYVHDPKDPGGETKFGISKRAYPDLDIKNLTKKEASFLYQRDYWDANSLDQFPPKIAEKLFDMAVNMGARRACFILMEAVKILKLEGHETIITAKNKEMFEQLSVICAPITTIQEKELRRQMRTQQARFYQSLATKKPALKRFLRGWLRRAAF